MIVALIVAATAVAIGGAMIRSQTDGGSSPPEVVNSGSQVQVKFDPPVSYDRAIGYAADHGLTPQTIVVEANGEQWTLFMGRTSAEGGDLVPDPSELLRDMSREGVDLGEVSNLRILGMVATRG